MPTGLLELSETNSFSSLFDKWVNMNQEDYEDYLVDKAKELMNKDLSEASDEKATEMRRKRNKFDERAEKESTSKIPVSWDPREVQHLAENRKKMDNQELKEFLQKDSELQEELKEVDDWKGFTRWEERFIIQNYQNMKPEEIAAELERKEKEIKLKIRVMGLKPEEY